MIEIVYDKNSANDDTKAKAGYVVPKNIRQIGNTSGSTRMNMERQYSSAEQWMPRI